MRHIDFSHPKVVSSASRRAPATLQTLKKLPLPPRWGSESEAAFGTFSSMHQTQLASRGQHRTFPLQEDQQCSLHIHPRVTADHILTLTVFGAADERARGLCAAMSCHTGSHHEREGLRRRDNAGVCAAAPERRALLSDRSRLTTAAARSAEGGEK
ncbi:hypothetical protein FQA47_008970 [Oryzias melastigma]|uniref:Uncharacterized protein n=1 Tax=Oryzias melastigma TaxID=30732 RepID=A0A834CKR2_ORYME|nr:hypothetical protein FQA47_008970 [Oryzias melastigma]